MRTVILDVSIPADNPSLASTGNELLVRKIFGLPNEHSPRKLLSQFEIPIEGITYITGFSGSGKSTLLRAIMDHFPMGVTQAGELSQGTRVVDSLQGSLADVIAWLGRFGLGEA